MSKTMSQTIGGRNLKVMMVTLALAVLLLTLVVVVETAPTTSDGNPAIHAMTGTGGASLTHDPYIDRHAEVVARLGGGSLR